jgi:hypothetical protein
MVPSLTSTVASAASRFRGRNFPPCLSLVLLQFSDFADLYTEKKGSVFNILWALVFGFATLNILGLVLRRFDPKKGSGLNFGEVLAITVVFFSIFLLGLEMLNVFHVFPVKLPPR